MSISGATAKQFQSLEHQFSEPTKKLIIKRFIIAAAFILPLIPYPLDVKAQQIGEYIGPGLGGYECYNNLAKQSGNHYKLGNAYICKPDAIGYAYADEGKPLVNSYDAYIEVAGLAGLKGDYDTATINYRRAANTFLSRQARAEAQRGIFAATSAKQVLKETGCYECAVKAWLEISGVNVDPREFAGI